MSTPLNVREIGTLKHKSAQFAVLSFYFPGENQTGQQMYASILCELYLVDGFLANILIRNDILSPEDFVININKNRALIESYGVTISINARQRKKFLRRKLFISNDNVVPPRFKTIIPLTLVSLIDRHFLFHPIIQANLTPYAQIVNHLTTKILVSNTFNCPLGIPRHQKLGHIIDICYENCFLADAQAIFNSAVFLRRAQLFFKLYTGIALAPTDTCMGTQLDNGMSIYGDKVAIREISELVTRYPSIWEFEGFVRISPER